MSGVVVNILTRLGIIGVAKGATTARQATVSDLGADHSGLDVADGGGSLTVDGAVSVSNFPATQPISGSVSVSNLPATQPVSGTVTANVGSSGSLALDATLTGGTQIAIAKGAAAAGASASGNPVLVGGVDLGGLVRSLLTSAAGIQQVSAAKGTSYSSAALEISKVVSASACLVSKIRVQNINGATRYVHIFNAAALPGNGTVPTVMFTLTANSGGEVVFPIPTDRFSTGLVVAASSTQGTLTISATADFLISVDLFPANA